jgi:hypothetical protein
VRRSLGGAAGLAGTRAALGNYVSMVFIRDNPQTFTAAVMTLDCYVSIFLDHSEVLRHGIHRLFDGASILTVWWLAAFTLPLAMMTQYWRQVRATLAPAIPGFVEAEFRAVCLMLIPVLAVLALPFLLLGAPVAGTLAMAAAGMLVGGGAAAGHPTGEQRLARRWRTMIFVPFMLVGFIPGMMGRLVFAPWPVALAVFMLASTTLIAGLRFYPARAASETEVLELRRDRQPPLPNHRVRALLAVLSWRPGFMPAGALPSAFGLTLGPAGALLASLLKISILIVVLCLLGSFRDGGWHAALHHSGPQAVGQGIAFGVLSGGEWLMSRGEWPALFAAGRFGGRLNFARQMFLAHGVNMAQRALADALVGTAYAAAFGAVQGGQVLALALVIFALVFGTGYAAAVPLLWKEFGGKGLAIGLRMAAMLLVMTLLTFGVFQNGLGWRTELPAAAVLLAGLVVAWIAPGRLAAMDWPFEAEPVVR